jgi:SAM-dependent methyltransferase
VNTVSPISTRIVRESVRLGVSARRAPLEVLVIESLRAWLAHPRTRHLDLDDPQTTALRRLIIRDKPFLRRVYAEWYEAVVSALPLGPGPVLELGSGAGFLRDFIPHDLITSERFFCEGVDAILDGQALPFPDESLRAIVLVDVLHHLPRVRSFFREAQRSLEPGGVVAMIEPWVTTWSRFVYARLHHEPFVPDAVHWEFSEAGPLSAANGALPWVVFARDRTQFERELPGLAIERIRPFMPFRYLLSGGVSLRSLMPVVDVRRLVTRGGIARSEHASLGDVRVHRAPAEPTGNSRSN